jgi:hypothetical protein
MPLVYAEGSRYRAKQLEVIPGIGRVVPIPPNTKLRTLYFPIWSLCRPNLYPDGNNMPPGVFKTAVYLHVTGVWTSPRSGARTTHRSGRSVDTTNRKGIMPKKTMLLALAAVSAALFAMPAVASANWGVDPTTQTFSGTSDGSLIGLLSVAGEPKFTCEGPDHMSGGWSNGTEGSFTIVLTSCHLSAGFTIPCKSPGAPLSNTIAISGKFTNVTIEGGKRGLTLTPVSSSYECGPSVTKVAGTIIGRITEDPAGCGAAVIDSQLTLEFLTKEGLQTPLRTDSMSISESDSLTGQTGSSAPVGAFLEHKFVLGTTSNTTWTCNAP